MTKVRAALHWINQVSNNTIFKVKLLYKNSCVTRRKKDHSEDTIHNLIQHLTIRTIEIRVM